ncbi:hypothetical protein GCM10023198_47060 [Promicromonospora umidemergens]|uniref:Uncharacterized protein n=1 Tax=Promicromonospora umidemergens TaxID=629679 RepID=A0ABP8Y1F0_9MICO
MSSIQGTAIAGARAAEIVAAYPDRYWMAGPEVLGQATDDPRQDRDRDTAQAEMSRAPSAPDRLDTRRKGPRHWHTNAPGTRGTGVQGPTPGPGSLKLDPRLR